jgi:hypothetical protein
VCVCVCVCCVCVVVWCVCLCVYVCVCVFKILSDVALIGPQVEHSLGRKDATDGKKCPMPGRLPDASKGAEHLREVRVVLSVTVLRLCNRCLGVWTNGLQ